MSIDVLSLLILLGLFGLLFIGVPFALAAGAIAVLVAFVSFGPGGMFLISSRTFELVTDYTMVAIPMFVLMAALIERSGIARDLYSALNTWFGRFRGGVLVATLAIAFILGATTGIVGGEVVLLGLVALPQMMRLGYSNRLTLGTITAGGSLGTMVPPSIVLILYGITAGVPVGDLFMATATPALLLVTLYITYVLIRVRLNPDLAPVAAPDILAEAGEGRRVLRDVGFPLFIVLAVLGTIYLGLASITESAAFGVAGVLLSIALRGELTVKLVREALAQTMLTSGVVLWLVFGTNALIGVYNAIGGIAFAQSMIGGIASDPFTLLLLCIVIFLILGFFVDWVGILFLTTPIFLPLIREAGFDPVWFGVIFNLTVQIAYITPPFAPSAFYLKSVAPPSVTLTDIYRSSWPFVFLQLIALILVVSFPQIALWLPRVLSG
jgi:tripartite ATP-independent transporter DctM subunit